MEKNQNQLKTTTQTAQDNQAVPSKQTPNSQTLKRRIGNTTFTINIHFSGTETAEDKMLRLIKNALAKSA
jgi:hypothetical protein